MSARTADPVEVNRLFTTERCMAVGGRGFCRRIAPYRVGMDPRCEDHAIDQLVWNLERELMRGGSRA